MAAVVGKGIPAGISGTVPLIVAGSPVGRVTVRTPTRVVQGSEGRRQ